MYLFFTLLSCAPGLKYLQGLWRCVWHYFTQTLSDTQMFADDVQSNQRWISFASAMNSHFLLCLSIVTSGLMFHTFASPLDKKIFMCFIEALASQHCHPRGKIFVFAITVYKSFPDYSFINM